MYFSLKSGSLKLYLLWFPITKLSNAYKGTIKSKDFYEEYIDSDSFSFYFVL